MTAPQQSWPPGGQPRKPRMKPWVILCLAIACLVAMGGILAQLGSLIEPTTNTAKSVAPTRAAVALAPNTTPTIDPATATPGPATVQTTAATMALAPPPITAAPPPLATHDPAPAPTTRRPAPAPTTKKPAPKPKPTPSSAPQAVHPGAFCAPEGAVGYTVKGTKMRCTFKSGDIRARWRAA